MKTTKRTLALAAAVVVGLVLAACAKTASPGASSSSSAPPPVTPAGLTVKTASVTDVGSVVVTSSDFTLYQLSADKNGKATCTSSPCTGIWPPLIVPAGGTVHAGSGIDASKLGTVKTPNGLMQVTYNNWPLYRYSGDSGPNQANGQGIQSFGGVWHPLDAAGKPVTSSMSSTPSSSSGGNGY